MFHDIARRRRLAGAALAATLLVACANDVPLPRNIVLISLDTVRYDRLSFSGHPKPTSPTLDRLVREGTSFSNAVATSPWTLPSHVSMLSGLYPHRHRVLEREHKMPDYVQTLAMFFTGTSLATAGIVGSSLLTPEHGFERGFEHFVYVSEWGPEPARTVSDEALKWLEQQGDEPFFLFVHYYDVHSDYAPADEYRALFVDPYDGTADGTTQQLVDVRMGNASFDERDTAHLLDLYDAEIRAVDDQVARVIGFLDENGLLDSTLVVVTSDHGEEFLEHGSLLHGKSYYDETIRIPLILRGPGVPVGETIDVPVNLVDVTPTLLALAGRPVPGYMQGIDLSRLWREPAAPHRTAVLAEADWQNDYPGMYRMIRDERYKLIHRARDGQSELYDLLEDPLEQRDIAAQNPKRVASLLAELGRQVAQEGTGETRIELSEEKLEQLRSLGYAR